MTLIKFTCAIACLYIVQYINIIGCLFLMCVMCIKLSIFGVWIVDQTKQAILSCQHWLWFHIFQSVDYSICALFSQVLNIMFLKCCVLKSDPMLPPLYSHMCKID